MVPGEDLILKALEDVELAQPGDCEVGNDQLVDADHSVLVDDRLQLVDRADEPRAISKTLAERCAGLRVVDEDQQPDGGQVEIIERAALGLAATTQHF